MSTTIIAVIVQILIELLPKLGITIGSDALTTTLQTIGVLAAGAWIWFRRVSKGDVNALGGVKN